MAYHSKEQLAIVGIGCRFPGGVTSAESFWKMVSHGTDAISDVPKDRWDFRKFFDVNDKRPGKSRVKQGGYLQQPLNKFDPLFFGISPREAAFIDPQQRILLEVTWEAFEDAGLTEKKLKGSNTGVFIGAFNLDNLLLQLGRDNLELITSSTAASVTMTMLSNRLSYAFDLTGPSVTIDTACSSSMVSTHYACQSIWSGDCEMAVAGGVNIISRPEYMVSMSKGGFLSPHGRCKSFDEDAKGYVRSEGAGIIIIKKLQQAIDDKDNIYALIRNTGINQDGYTQNGISFPSADAQKRLIQKVYQESDTNPLDVTYIEAHGTGTQAGDPIEILALSAVLTKGRNLDTPCYVGSVKSNIGHTESAAGVAGIIKTSLSISKGAILPNIHFNKANPNIDFAGGRITVPVKLTPWLESGKPRMASVNSFGYGGTNGHIILQEYIPDQKIITTTQESIAIAHQPPCLIPLTAKTANALKAVCKQLQNFLTSEQGKAIDLVDLNYSLAYRRSVLDERLSLIVTNTSELVEKLAAITNGDYPEGSSQQSADPEESLRMVFVFTGMGPQWWGMGRELYATEPVFKQKVDECDEFFTRLTGWSIKAELLAPEEQSQMAKTCIAQPANFVIQVALLDLYHSWGIQPSAVVGHSVGEVASAYAAGALSLEDALLVSFHRSRLQQTVAGNGAMLAIGIGGENAKVLADLYDRVSVAAVNSTTSITLAGDSAQLEEIAQILETQSAFNRMLQVEVAYHSYQMDPIETELRQALASISPQAEKLPIYSTVTGNKIAGEQFNAGYWWQNVRQPVSFEQAIKHIIDDGYVHFLEVGPHPVTRNFINECLADKNVQGRVFSSLIRKKDEKQSILESLGQIFTAGYSLTWPTQIQNANFVRLPTYPWQREAYWNESPLSKQYLLGNNEKHPYFFEKLMTPEPSWQVEINENYFPFLMDHKISSRVVFPGAGYIEAGLALQFYQKGKTGIYSLENLKFHRMLMLDADKAQQLRVVEHKETSSFSVYSSEVNNSNWTLHASGQLVTSALKHTNDPIDLTTLIASFQQTLNRDALYSTFDQRGLGYGPQFQTVREIRVAKGRVLSKIYTPSSLTDSDAEFYRIYPTLLDGAFQSLIVLDNSANAVPMVPIEVGVITVYQKMAPEFWCYGELVDQSSSSMTCNLQLIANDGTVLAELENLVFTEIAVDTEATANHQLDDCFYQLNWINSIIVPDSGEHEIALNNHDNWILLAHNEHAADTKDISVLAEKLVAKGVNPHTVNLTELQNNFNKGVNKNSDGYLAILKITFEKLLKPGRNQVLYLPNNLTHQANADLTLDSVVDPCLPLIALAQSLESPATEQGNSLKSSADLSVRLSVITCGAQVVEEKDAMDCLSAMAVASLIHLLGNEVASIKPKHIDLPAQKMNREIELDSLVKELTLELEEEDIALRGDQRFVKKLVAVNLESGARVSSDMVAVNNCNYNIGIEYTADENPGFKFNLIDIPTVQKDDVLIQLDKVALDQATITNIVTSRAGKVDGSPSLKIGIGKIVSLGQNVSQFKRGDRVIAVIPNQELTSHVLVNGQFCVGIDENFSENLALDYLAYATALHLLNDLADGIDDRIFIQNAFYPTGLALVQLALLKGIAVYATADTHFKRNYIKTMGVQYVFDNSDLTYISDIKNLVGKKGFKIIINNLGNEHFQHCFKLIGQGGKLIQLSVPTGQALQFPAQTTIGSSYNYSYIDFAHLIQSNPEVFINTHSKLQALWSYSSLVQLPKTSVAVSDINFLTDHSAADECFTQAVIEFAEQSVKIFNEDAVGALNRQATYLVTGGTSGLGLEIAKWLIINGVNSLALVSRSGLSRPEVKVFAQAMNAVGKNVQVFDIDITDIAAVDVLVKNISTTMLPLRGIIHCAMVLDDDLTVKMDRVRMDKVMAPKVQGALNLHNATKHLPLAQFISISSISSIIGNVGQMNYVAANAFLDGFSHFRRQAGLAGTTINLGVLQEIGIVSRNADLANVLNAKGIRGLSTDEVTQGLGYIFNNNPVQIGFFRVDWSSWSQEFPKSAASSRFKDLVQQARADQDMSPALVNLLKLLEDQEHYFARLMNILSNELAQVIKIPVSEIKYDRNISDLGIDSLMSAEFSRGLRAKYGLEVTSMELLSGPSLEQLTENLAAQLTEKV